MKYNPECDLIVKNVFSSALEILKSQDYKNHWGICSAIDKCHDLGYKSKPISTATRHFNRLLRPNMVKFADPWWMGNTHTLASYNRRLRALRLLIDAYGRNKTKADIAFDELKKMKRNVARLSWNKRDESE